MGDIKQKQNKQIWMDGHEGKTAQIIKNKSGNQYVVLKNKNDSFETEGKIVLSMEQFKQITQRVLEVI